MHDVRVIVASIQTRKRKSRRSEADGAGESRLRERDSRFDRQVYEPRVDASLGHATAKGNPTPMRGNDTPRRKLRSTSRAREPTGRRVFKQSSESVDRVRPRAGIADLSFGLKASKEAMTLRIADGSDRRSISIQREAPIARAYKVHPRG